MGENNKTVFRVIHNSIQLICLVGFAWLVHGTCKTYLNHATMTVTTTQKQTELPLPVFWVCYETPFKEHFYEQKRIFIKQLNQHDLDKDFVNTSPYIHPFSLSPDEFKKIAKDPSRLVSSVETWSLKKDGVNTVEVGIFTQIF